MIGELSGTDLRKVMNRYLIPRDLVLRQSSCIFRAHTDKQPEVATFKRGKGPDYEIGPLDPSEKPWTFVGGVSKVISQSQVPSNPRHYFGKSAQPIIFVDSRAHGELSCGPLTLLTPTSSLVSRRTSQRRRIPCRRTQDQRIAFVHHRTLSSSYRRWFGYRLAWPHDGERMCIWAAGGEKQSTNDARQGAN
jgi:hypothetical protein